MEARTTLITGGAKRLGRELVCHLASQGWDVILHYRQAHDAAQALAADIMRLYPVKVHLWQCDFSNFTAKQLHNLPPFQLLINNAAIFQNDTLFTCTAQTLQNHYQVNCIAPILLMQRMAALTPIEANIININDSDIFKKPKSFFSYLNSKKSLHHLTEDAAVLLAPNIRVNAIALGYILQGTRQSAQHFQHGQQDALLPHAPATIAQLLSAIDFILAMPSLTGQTLMLDGGRYLTQNTVLEKA